MINSVNDQGSGLKMSIGKSAGSGEDIERSITVTLGDEDMGTLYYYYQCVLLILHYKPS